MALQRSRFNGQEVVNSFNIFVDSQKASVVGDQQSKGDDVHIHFGGQTIEAGDGENIRLSLLNFTMFNNLYMVNANNRRFNVRGSSSTTANFLDVVHINMKNYNNLKDLAENFADNLIFYLISKTACSSFTKTTILPASTTMSATDDRLLNITLTGNTGHGLSSLKVQCADALGDSYMLLGAKRQDDDTDTTFDSLQISFPTTTTISIKGFFPMQRLTDPYVYLRCNNAQSGLETSVLSSDRGLYNTDIVNSDIFAKLFKNVEFINYESNTGEEYIMNLQQRKLANLRLFLTDSKSRRLGRLTSERNNGTASGLQDSNLDFVSQEQNTLGNLSFTAVIRVDIVKNSSPAKLDSMPPAPALPAREAQSALVWLDHGKPKY